MLPHNTYYKNNALINTNNVSNRKLLTKIKDLELKVDTLEQELKDVREYIKSNSKQATSET